MCLNTLIELLVATKPINKGNLTLTQRLMLGKPGLTSQSWTSSPNTTLTEVSLNCIKKL